MNNSVEWAAVLAEYDLQPGSYECAPLLSGTANKNFTVETQGERRILRLRNPKYSGEGWMRFEAEYLAYARGQGLPVPLPFPSRDGLPWVRAGERVYQLYDFIGGDPFQRDNPEQIREAGVYLGTLHRALGGFRPLQDKNLPRYDNPVNILRAARETLQDDRLPKSEEARATLAFVERTAARLLAAIPDERYDRLPHVCIHGDYHPANVKYDGNRVCGLFDFDWISIQPRIRDVVDGIAYFAAIRDGEFNGADIFSLTQTCRFELPRIRLFAEAYQSHAEGPLTAEEIELLPLLIQARLLHSRVEALAKIPADRRVEMLTKGIQEPLQWLEDHRDSFPDCCE